MCRIILLAIILMMCGEQAVSQKMYSTARTPANMLANSQQFYKTLGFKQLANNTLAYTDGKVVIEIDTHKATRAGMNLYKTDWSQELKLLEANHNIIKTPGGHALADPSGVWIYLLDSNHAGYPTTYSSYSVLGNNQGVCLETGNMKASYALYTTLGFHSIVGSPDKGYVVLSDANGFNITLMKPGICPHLFFNPSITYFNGKQNPSIIKKIKQLNIPVTQEVTWFNKEGITDNVILRDPGGYGFFIFND